MLPVASLAYLVLLVLPVLNFIRNYRYVQSIRRYGLLKADVKWRMFVQNVAARMGITKPVSIWMSEWVTAPVTIGYLKPIVLLPVAAVNHLSTEQIEAVLLHELSHIKRFDFLINLITRAVQTILYFNPFVKAFAKIIETEREKHCDEIVLQFQYEPHDYASALLTLEKSATRTQTLAVAANSGKKQDLLARIESILGIHKKQVFPFNKLAGIMAALLCFICLNALVLLSKPGDTKLKPGLLTDLSVPFHLFTPAAETREMADVAIPFKEITNPTIINEPSKKTTTPKNEGQLPATVKVDIVDADAPEAPLSPEALNSLPFMQVNFRENILPELDAEAQKQVEQALNASKKVMTEDQWKMVEKNIADAMNSEEKEKLKVAYEKAMAQKVDWESMEHTLKASYDEINWNRINTQLNTALVDIKLDSLKQVYTAVIADLSSVEKELKKANQSGIPDSDITLRSISQQKKEVQKIINTIKLNRHRKIVHL
jgi:beta-lactamase regulating signal transducer with metallopeptidase domain